MKKLVVVVLALILVGFSYGQAGGFGMERQWELGGDLGFTSITPVANGNTGDATSVFSISPYAGYFVTDQFEIGLRPVIEITSPPVGDSFTLAHVFAAPAWNFKLEESTITPFIEALLGFSTASSGGNSASGFSWGAHGGIKAAVGGNGLLNVGAQYIAYTLNPSGASERNGMNQFGVTAGFTVFIGQ